MEPTKLRPCTSPQHVRTEHRGDPGSRILYDKLSVRTWAAILNSAPRIPPVFAPHMLGTCTSVGGLRQSKIVNGTLGIVIRCKLMVAMMLSHLDIQNRISIT